MARSMIDDLFAINREMNRIFDQARYLASAPWPETNVYESHNEFVLVSKIPGMDKKDISLSVQDGTLSISGKREVPEEADAKRHLSERFTGSFSRSFRLNDSADSEHIQAEAKNGLLMVRIPKKPEAKPKRIQIR